MKLNEIASAFSSSNEFIKFFSNIAYCKVKHLTLINFFNKMKTFTPICIQRIFILLFLFIVVCAYGQAPTSSNNVLFGKPIIKENHNPNKGIIRCATVEYEQYLQEKNPKRRTNTQFENWLSPLVYKEKAIRTSSRTAATVITIPVVVHVIHNGQGIGTAPNITDAQVESQITVLNQDFRKMLGTPGFNSNPVGADVQIEFVLAKQDPNGNSTNGIDRVTYPKNSFSETEIETILKPATIWNPELYMNMWSLKFTRDDLLGYAQFPDGSSLDGLNASGGGANTDGVVSSYDVFGSSDFGNNFFLAAPYNKGRTMTHEVGHYLGLLHIWGDGGSRDSNTKDCTASDYCADTPQAGWENYDCNEIYDSCPVEKGNDMPENYMDYTNDECMNIFTQNQKDRITVIMNNAARRASLKTSTKAILVPTVPNDASVKILTFNSNLPIGCTTPLPLINKEVTISNRGTSSLTSVTLNYNIDGGANQKLEWKGSLEQYQSTNVTLQNTNVNGNLTVSVALANGVLDVVETNNTASSNYFNLETANFNFTTYVFNLQQDFWGSEITWNIKDSTGKIKYSGGPYEDSPEKATNLPALITQNWQLDKNQCYTFTINDSEGDGICCLGGEGFYNIKSSDGDTIVGNGASYGTIENKYFTTNIIEPNEFLNKIHLHPNPSTNRLNIGVESNSDLPDSYIINNLLGQKMNQKIILNNEDLVVDISNFSKGVYFITVTKENQLKTLQFIKE